MRQGSWIGLVICLLATELPYLESLHFDVIGFQLYALNMDFQKHIFHLINHSHRIAFYLILIRNLTTLEQLALFIGR